MHDCRADSEALFYLHGIRMRAVWDTQVRAALKCYAELPRQLLRLHVCAMPWHDDQRYACSAPANSS